MWVPPESEFVAWCTQRRVALLAALPGDMGEIANVCGFTPLFKLVKTHGGRRVYVGPNSRGDTKLAAIVGKTVARRIGSIFGGEYINVMSHGALVALYRRMRGVEMAEAGKPAGDICAALGVTRRTAFEYLRQTRERAERAR